MLSILLLFLFQVLINTTISAQVAEERLCIKNSKDQIYAIIHEEVVDAVNSGEEGAGEAYGDFVHHTEELEDKIDIDVKFYISLEVFFMDQKIDLAKENSGFIYLLVKQKSDQPEIIRGIDTAASLKSQIDAYYSENSK